MIPSPAPDRAWEAREAMRARIRKDGFLHVLQEMVDAYYAWETEPELGARRRKHRATLVFSRRQIEVLVSQTIFQLVDDPQFLLDHTPKPKKKLNIGMSEADKAALKEET